MSAANYTPETLLKDLKALGWVKQKTEYGTLLAVRQLVRSPKAQERLRLPKRHVQHDDAIAGLGLPKDLLALLEQGTLVAEVQKAYEAIDAMNARLDAWELAHPEKAKAVPWAESREAWKSNGSPKLEWWEALLLTQGLRSRR